MFSRPCRLTATLALGCALALAIACGHKESPKPPPQRIPQPVRDLKVTQRGDQLRLSFTYPQTTISGLPIDDIVAIELWEFQMPVPDFAGGSVGDDEEGEAPEGDSEAAGEGEGADDGEPVADGEAAAESEMIVEEPTPAAESEEIEPVEEAPVEGAPVEETPTEETAEGETAEAEGDRDEEADDDEDEDRTPKEQLLEVDPLQFVAAANKRVVLEGDDLSNAIKGDQVELQLTLNRIEPGEKEARVYAVKTFQTLKRASAFSNLVRIIPRVTPDPPTDVEVKPDAKGVQVTWTFEGDEPEEFRFYRRDPRSSGFSEHHGTQAGDSDRYLDSRAELGSSYVYAMTIVVNRTPLVESVFSAEHEIQYDDAFPPEPPTELVALSDIGSARLLWEEVEDDDLAGYLVYRRAEGGDYGRLFEEPIRQTEYSDTSTSSGRTFYYRVVAVDLSGNQSDPSEEVQVRIP